MINEPHISAIQQIFDKLFATPNLIVGSFLTTTFTTYFSIVKWIYNIDTIDLFGMSLPLICSCAALMMADWFLGLTEAIRVKNEKISADKIVYTIMKFVMFFGWLYFMKAVRHEMETYGYMKDVIILINIFVLFLIILREFRSIGNHINAIWGSKPYLFILIDEIFSIVESGFKKKLKDKFELNEEQHYDDEQ